MTLTIIDDCTHNKTFSVYDKPNGTIRILEKAGYHLNPVVHAVSEHATDGSCGPSSALTSELLPPMLPLGRGEKVGPILTAALAKWGIKSQIDVTVEECCELSVKLMKLDRKHNGSTIEEVSEEMADVRVMLDQMEIAFDNWDLVARIYAEKISKLEKMVMEVK